MIKLILGPGSTHTDRPASIGPQGPRPRLASVVMNGVAPLKSNGFRGSPVVASDHIHVSRQVLGLVTGRQTPDRVCGCHRVHGRFGAVSTGPRSAGRRRHYPAAV
jgi:hypothetical protein